MLRLTTLALIFVAIMISACGKKEESSTCAAKIRKEFKDNNIKATVEEGCIVKYIDANSYKITGNVDMTIIGDTLSKKSIILSKGELITSNGRFVLKSNDNVMKIRLVSGSGSVVHNGKNVPLLINNVLEIGK